MKLMTKPAILLAVGGLFLLPGLPALAQKTDQSVNSRPLSIGDGHFVREAGEGGIFQVAAGRLAVQKASNSDIRQFGQRMIDDHSKANDELKRIAAKDSLTFPARMSSRDHATLNRLSNLSGTAFDRAYIRDMVKDHESDLAAFQREANNGANADVKTWAMNTVPMIQDHLSQAKMAEGSIGVVSRK